MGVAPAQFDDDLAAELAALRLRAFGPGAGLGDDVAAGARLAELEAAARARSKQPSNVRSWSEPGGGDASARVGTSRRADAPALADASDRADASARADASDRADGPDPVLSSDAARWRRLWPWLLFAAVAGCVAAYVFVEAGRPAAVLGPSSESRSIATIEHGTLGFYALDPAELVALESYHGIAAWSGVNERGRRCLIVGWRDRVWVVRCVPAGLDPIVDVTISPDMSDIPPGSLVRLTLVGDSVEVRFAPVDLPLEG